MGQRSSRRLAASKAMTTEQHGLQAGLVEFSDPAFLLIGEAGAFDWLAEQIESRREVALQSESNKEVACLSLVPSTHDDGAALKKGTILEWQMSANEATQVAQQLRELAASSAPAHAYLDPANNLAGLQIIASKGEYDPTRIFAE